MDKIVKQKMVVSGVIINPNKKVLLVRRAEKDNFLPGYWEFPGGKIEEGETVERGLEREIMEECNLGINIAFPLLVRSFFDKKQLDEKYQYFEIFCLCGLKNNDSCKLSEEHSHFAWVWLNEAFSFHITVI